MGTASNRVSELLVVFDDGSDSCHRGDEEEGLTKGLKLGWK